MKSFTFPVLVAAFICFIHGITVTARGCTSTPIGLNSRETFPDHYFTASSYLKKDSVPHFARIDSPTCWKPLAQDYPGDYLQVDLGIEYKICAVATKGSGKGGSWTKTFKIALSNDNGKWDYYKDQGYEKNFYGNKDSNTFRKNSLKTPASARFVRFYPLNYKTRKALRIELYGIQIETCKHALGLENYGIGNTRMVVTSGLDADKAPNDYLDTHGAFSARLHGKYAWRGKSYSKIQYLQVDLGQVKTVTGIATQGDPEQRMWVTSYSLSYAKVMETWIFYTPPDWKMFHGNSDKDGVVVNWFTDDLHMRYLRVLPQTWISRIALRMELYGCLRTELSCDNQPIGMTSRMIHNFQMTATSAMNDATPAHHGRLHFTDDSWCALPSDSDPYLQIDLEAVYVLCAVATQGNAQENQWIKTYRLMTSLDGKTWKYYNDVHHNRIFDGNFDRNSVTKHVLDNKAVGRFVRFIPKTHFGARCIRTELYGSTREACSTSAVGASSTGSIPDYRFTASSFYSKAYMPSFGRVQGPTCWGPKTNDKRDYLQVDLGSPHVVCAVGSQGCGRNDEKTLTYNLAFSMDGITWVFYKKNGNDKEFPGPKDRVNKDGLVNIAKNVLPFVQVAKFVRFFSVKYAQHKSMRVEVYGLPQAWRRSAGVEEPHGLSGLSDKQLTASSSADTKHIESDSRLYGVSSWCVATSTINSYLEIDFGTAKQVNGFATQGDPKGKGYVTDYDVQWGFTSERWSSFEGLTGNTNANGLMVHWLTYAIGVRYFRFLPKEWKGAICMRIDLYGNDKVPPPTITEGKIHGTLKDKTSSHVDIHCMGIGDQNLKFKWFTNNHDVTSKSRGQVYSRGQVSSHLRINFTSASDFNARFPCIKIDYDLLMCKIVYTCHAYYGNVAGEHRDHKITIIIDIPEPGATEPPTVESSRPHIPESDEEISAGHAMFGPWNLVFVFTLSILGFLNGPSN